MDIFEAQCEELERRYRAGQQSSSGATRLAAMREAVDRRVVRGAGARPPATYRRCIDHLVEWAQESMDEEMLGEYEVAECLTDGELSEKLEDRGVAFDAAAEDGERMDRAGAEDRLVELQGEEMGRGTGLELHDESHPEGLRGVAPLPFATYRSGYPWNPAGADQKDLPAEVSRWMGGRFLRVRVVSESEAEWGGAEKLMVECGVVGVPSDTEFPDRPGLEVIELMPPHTTAVWSSDVWSMIPVVATIAEAAALASRDSSVSAMKVADGRAKVNFDADASLWDAKVYRLDGTEVRLTGGKPSGSGGGGWSELCRLCNVPEDVVLRGDRRKVAEGFVDCTAEAMHAMAVGSKGRGKELTAVPVIKLGKDFDLLDGTDIGKDTPAMVRLTLAMKVGKAEATATASLPDCEVRWWCILCNITAIGKVMGDEFSAEDVRQGRVVFTGAMKEAIAALPAGKVQCSCPASGKGGEFAYPPFHAMVACPRCEQWMETPSEVVQGRCDECSLPFNFPGAVEFKGAEHHSVRAASRLTTLQLRKDRDAQRFHYLRKAGGENVFEQAGLPTNTLVEMQVAMNEVRGRPEMLGDSVVVPCEITPRLMGLVPTGRWDELSLWDFQPMGYQEMAQVGAYSVKQLETEIKAVQEGRTKPPNCKVPKATSNFLLTRYMIECSEIKFRVGAMVWGERFNGDVAVAGDVLKTEITAPVNAATYSESKVVWRVFESTSTNFSTRLERQCQQPHVSMLHAYEREHGNCIRPLPCLACEEFIRAVPLAMEQKMRALAVSSMAAEEREIPGFGVPEPADGGAAKKKDGTSKGGLKEKAEEPKKETGADSGELQGGAPKSGSERQESSAGKAAPNSSTAGGAEKSESQGGSTGKEWWMVKPKGKEAEIEGSSKGYSATQCQAVQEAGKAVQLKQGEFHGESATLKYAHLMALAPFNGGGKRYCPKFQTKCGCDDPFCPLSHEVLPAERWPLEWHLLFLIQGGHKDWQGELKWSELGNLLSEGQALSLSQLGEAAGREMLLYHLARRLSHLSKATGEPMESDPVQEEGYSQLRRELWGGAVAAPFKVAATSGITVETVARVLIGRQDAVFNGLAFDAGEQVGELPGLCHIRALACGLGASNRWTPEEGGEGADVVLLREIVEELLAIDFESVQPGSRLAQLVWAWSWFLTEGVPDDGFQIVDPASLRNRNLFQIRDGDPSKPLELNLNLARGNAGNEGVMVMNRKNSSNLKDRKFSKEAHQCEVLAILISGGDESRHSEWFKLSKDISSLAALMKKTGPMVKLGKAVLQVGERGTAAKRVKVNNTAGKLHIRQVSAELLKEAEERIRGMPSVVGVLTDRQRRKEENQASEEGLEKALDSVVTQVKERTSRARAELEKVQPQMSKEELTAEWRKWHDERAPRVDAEDRKPLKTQSDFLRMWKLHYVPLLDQVDQEDPDQPHRLLTYCGRFFNLWLRNGQGKTPRERLELMVTSLREDQFGARAGQGPQWEDLEEMLTGALSEGHVNLLKESVVRGADPVFLDSLEGKGMVIESHLSALLVENKVLWDQVEELCALRALVFDVTESGMPQLLKRAGVRISPIVTAPKTDAAGRPRIAKDGTPAQRVCVDCREAVNDGVFSGDHTTQKTTSPVLVVQGLLKEERKFPAHQIRMIKDDIVAAFRQVAHRLRSVGLFATQAAGSVCVHLTMIFGSGVSPGCFEPYGDVIIQTVMGLPRDSVFPESDKEQSGLSGNTRRRTRKGKAGRPPETGDTHPEARRFVDDIFSIVALFGERVPDHLQRMRRVITSLFGREGLNLEKQGEEGEPTTFKHAFGVVIDSVKRLAGAPWSKIVKLKDLVTPFINGEEDSLDYSLLTRVRGLASHVLVAAPGLARILMPRLDAGLSDLGKRFPGEQSRIPSTATPSFKLKGETHDQGRLMLRRALALVVRLGGIRKGALFRVPWEHLLPREIRTTWPGREAASNEIRFLMDASGSSLFLIDLATGKYFRVAFTELEQELFNDFESEFGITINDRELLSELFGVVLLAPDHPRAILNMVNDNTAAQNWTDKNKHRSGRVDQILSVIGLFELTLKLTVWGSRVNTDENFADTGTRLEKRSQDFVKGLQELEQEHGWKAMGLCVEDWVRDMGWNMLDSPKEDGSWYGYAERALQSVEQRFPGLMEKCCEVPIELILEQLREAYRGEPIRGEWLADGDFPEQGKSAQREELTSRVRPTQNQLRKKLLQARSKFGEEDGNTRFNREWGGEYGDDPQEVIGEVLEKQRKESFKVLAVENSLFDKARAQEGTQCRAGSVVATCPLPTIPEDGETWQAARREGERLPVKAGVQAKVSDEALGGPMEKWVPPEGHRLDREFDFCSDFAGISPFSQAKKTMGVGRLKLTSEANPRLRKRLEMEEPLGEHLDDTKKVQETRFKDELDLLFSSPICVAFTQVNLYREGVEDEWMGQHWAEGGDRAEHLAVVAAAFECTLLVPVKKLEQRLPSYHVQVMQVDAGRTLSPLTQQQSPLNHVRVHVVAWRKTCFCLGEVPVLVPNQAPCRKDFLAELDEPWEAQWVQEMPAEDQHALATKFSRSGDGAAYVASVFDPEPGRGHHEFVNEVVDPALGRAPPWTGTGGGVWTLREFNRRATVVKQSNREGFRLYCARGIPDELKAEDSYLGQSVIGNMIPMNVSDWIYFMVVMEVTRIQSDGKTALEKHWEQRAARRATAETQVGTEPSSRGKKRPSKLIITAEMHQRVLDTIRRVQDEGKRPKTLGAYASAVRDWSVVARARGWSEDLSGVSLEEGQKRVMYFMGVEKSEFKLQARSIRSKLSGIRWWHVKRLKGNPLEAMDGVYAWLKDLEKVDGPAEPKLPVPISVLQLLFLLLSRDELDAFVKKAALTTGFFLLLRSAEYLKADNEDFDPTRALTWEDLQCRVGRKKASFKEAAQALRARKPVSIGATLFSFKNNLETCTRTVAAVYDSDICTVHALVALYLKLCEVRGKDPGAEEAVFTLESGQVLSRGEVSNLLKAAAAKSGVPQARVASHSLRRGGASAYIASGECSEEAVMRHGRWTSTAYHDYVFPHSEALMKALEKAHTLVPRFERN